MAVELTGTGCKGAVLCVGLGYERSHDEAGGGCHIKTADRGQAMRFGHFSQDQFPKLRLDNIRSSAQSEGGRLVTMACPLLSLLLDFG